MSLKCYGSTSVSKTEGRGSTPWRDAIQSTHRLEARTHFKL